MDNPPVQLISIKPSENKSKKYDAKFILENGKIKTVSFGAAGYVDYTTATQDEAEKKRNLYLSRHKKESNLWLKNPDTPAALSRWILWENKDINKAINKFRKKFNLNKYEPLNIKHKIRMSEA